MKRKSLHDPVVLKSMYLKNALIRSATNESMANSFSEPSEKMILLYEELARYVGLIITNCIIMGRVEAFALGNKPWPSFLDGIGNGLGYGMILVTVAFFRELLGSGSLLGFRIVPESWYIANGGAYSNMGLMLFPPMALIIVGCIIWIHRSYNKDLQEK